jgi:ribonuclease BN (tRNA processing enzyme)
MDLTILGSSGGYATPGNPASGYLITHGDTVILCDAGSGTFMALLEHCDPHEVDAIVISHVHVDHCADLVAFHGYMAHVPSTTIPVPVFAPAGTVEPIAGFLRADGDHVFFRTFDFRIITDSDQAVIGDISMQFATTHHPVPTIATRFSAEGHSLAYSADTGPGGGFPGLADGADVVLCEATGIGQRERTSYEYHLNAGEAGALAAVAGGRLILTHISPTVDPEVARAEAAATYGAEPLIAVPGAKVTV